MQMREVDVNRRTFHKVYVQVRCDGMIKFGIHFDAPRVGGKSSVQFALDGWLGAAARLKDRWWASNLVFLPLSLR